VDVRGVIRLGLVLVVLLLAWRMLGRAPAPNAPPPEAGRGRGTLVVRLPADAAAAGGAEALLRGAGVMYTPVRPPAPPSAGDGAWRAFEQVPEGEYALVTRAGGRTRETPVRVRAGAVDTVLLDPAPAAPRP
jgi:hypothetical protein